MIMIIIRTCERGTLTDFASSEGKELESRGTGRTGNTCFRFNHDHHDGDEDGDDDDGDEEDDDDEKEALGGQAIHASGSFMMMVVMLMVMRMIMIWNNDNGIDDDIFRQRLSIASSGSEMGRRS